MPLRKQPFGELRANGSASAVFGYISDQKTDALHITGGTVTIPASNAATGRIFTRLKASD